MRPTPLMSTCTGDTTAPVTGLRLSCRYAGTLLDEDIFRGKELVSSRPLQALVAGLKAYSTWENVSCLQDCRECTGGMVSTLWPLGPRSSRVCMVTGYRLHAACVGGGPCGQWALEPGEIPVCPCDSVCTPWPCHLCMFVFSDATRQMQTKPVKCWVLGGPQYLS